MKPVKVRIVSRNKGDESQTIEHHYSGQFAEKQGKNYVIYAENEQSGLEGTKTTIKWDQERILICVTVVYSTDRSLLGGLLITACI